MAKWLFAVLLVIQAHFVHHPLDREAQGAFGGLLKWAWSWTIDDGLLGRITASGFPVAEFFLAVSTAGVFILAALAVVGSVRLVEGVGYGRSYPVAPVDGGILRSHETVAYGP